MDSVRGAKMPQGTDDKTDCHTDHGAWKIVGHHSPIHHSLQRQGGYSWKTATFGLWPKKRGVLNASND